MLGQAFLSSLDTAGRRWRDGMRILHAGKVTEFSAAIESGQCTVAADVHGTYDARFHSQVPTYKTSLAFDPLSAWNLSKVKALGDKDSPEEVFLKCDSKNIIIVPRDLFAILNGECTCPDFGGRSAFGAQRRRASEPCKHLAALVYKIADCIDKDSSFLFYLRGVDLNAPQLVAPPTLGATTGGKKRAHISLIEGDHESDPIYVSSDSD